MRASVGEAERFLHEVVLKFDGQSCLMWPFGNCEHYPVIRINGRARKVHQVVCQAVHGDPPSADHVVAHSCGNGVQGCVAPRHLRWATRADNEADKILHGKANRGSRHGMSKLTERDVIEIRSMKNKAPQRELADQFGVRQPMISRIQSGKFWKQAGAG
jgi:HNH endonuclease